MFGDVAGDELAPQDRIASVAQDNRTRHSSGANEGFGGWTKTFAEPRLCAAIVDRLTYNATVLETGTESYRLAQSRNQNDN